MKKFKNILMLAAAFALAGVSLSGCVVVPDRPAYGYGYGYHHGYWER